MEEHLKPKTKSEKQMEIAILKIIMSNMMLGISTEEALNVIERVRFVLTEIKLEEDAK